MNLDEQTRSDRPANGDRQKTSTEDSGLSFEAEPTDIEGAPDQGGSTGSDPGRSSPSAAFTPGSPADPHSPLFTPGSMAVAAMVIALIIAALWLL